jgi:hypothetical protein
MNRKRILIGTAVLAIAIVSGSIAYFTASVRNSGNVNGLRIIAAAKQYKASLKAKDVPIPGSVSLQELISRQLLTESDVSGFAGMAVTVNLVANEGEVRPQDVLIRAPLSDGHEIVALADGSVQQLPDSR